MNRRRFLLTSLAGALGAPLAAGAQQVQRVARVGVLAPGAGPRPGNPPLAALQAFRKGLEEHGYIVSKNLILETRWDEGRPETHAQHAQDLIGAGVDVIVASTTASTLAAHKATKTIPVVMAASGGGNPVELRLEMFKRTHPGGLEDRALLEPDPAVADRCAGPRSGRKVARAQDPFLRGSACRRSRHRVPGRGARSGTGGCISAGRISSLFTRRELLTPR